METVPLLELVFGEVVSLVRVPVEHGLEVFDAHGFTIRLEDALRIVEQVVGIDDTNLDVGGSSRSVAVALLAADLGSDQAGELQIIEQTTQLVVAGFTRHERVETRAFDQRRNAAAVIAGNRRPRVANEESEMELLQELPRHDGRVVELRFGFFVRKRRTFRRTRRRSTLGTVGSVQNDARVVVAGSALLRINGRSAAAGCDRSRIGADTALDFLKRWSNTRRLLFRGNEIMRDVFDEDTLPLLKSKRRDISWRCFDAVETGTID